VDRGRFQQILPYFCVLAAPVAAVAAAALAVSDSCGDGCSLRGGVGEKNPEMESRENHNACPVGSHAFPSNGMRMEQQAFDQPKNGISLALFAGISDIPNGPSRQRTKNRSQQKRENATRTVNFQRSDPSICGVVAIHISALQR